MILAYFVGFFMLINIHGMKLDSMNKFNNPQSSRLPLRKVGDPPYCTIATIHDYACHEHCHNTTTYIRDCDNYNTSCDSLTTHFDICNSTGCHNTTRQVFACYTEQCADGSLYYKSWFNTEFLRNRTSHVHVCYTDGSATVDTFNLNLLKTVCGSFGVLLHDSVRSFFDDTCVEAILMLLRRRFGS